MTDQSGAGSGQQLLEALQQDQERFRLHLGVAEQGKVYALAGDHKKALVYYREAMRMTVEAGDPEVFFRHYLECSMESLERMGALAEVLQYCDKVIEFYANKPPPNPLATLDLASTHQRRGAVLLKSGDPEGAEGAFQAAVAVAGEVEQKLPLAQQLLSWVQRRMHVDAARVLAEQERADYFSVRAGAVDPARAVKLPNEAALII